jgi:DNA transformation protein and related proteins
MQSGRGAWRSVERLIAVSVSADFLAYVLEQLGGRGYTSRRMFGGVGLYSDGLFFALIADDTLYFKVDDSNRADFVARNSEAFRPFPDDPNTVSMSYFRVPVDVLEDADELARWTAKARNVAAAAAAAKFRPPRAKKKRAKKKESARRR